jgi:hypothetical protein
MTESERLASALRKHPPRFVRDFSLTLDHDLDGDPAVFLWVVIDDDAFERPDFFEQRDAARRWITEALATEALATEGIERWPYLRYRGVSEIKPDEDASAHESAH